MPISREVQQRKADVTEAADEAVVGIEMVQAFGREDEVRARFPEKAEAVRDGVLREAGVEARYLPGLLFLPSMAIAIVLFFGGRDVIAASSRSASSCSSTRCCCSSCGRSRRSAGSSTSPSARLASASRSFAWLDGDRAAARARRAPRRCPTGPLDVRFDDVHFAYGDGRRGAVAASTSTSRPGEIVAVCGATGSGKSSLLNLLPRFYDPTAGSVRARRRRRARRAADRPPRAPSRLVTQRPVLFSMPLRDNLSTARPDAPGDEMLEAARRPASPRSSTSCPTATTR